MNPAVLTAVSSVPRPPPHGNSTFAEWKTSAAMRRSNHLAVTMSSGRHVSSQRTTMARGQGAGSICLDFDEPTTLTSSSVSRCDDTVHRCHPVLGLIEPINLPGVGSARVACQSSTALEVGCRAISQRHRNKTVANPAISPVYAANPHRP